ncbi:hypothetical protein [Ancylobacter lacus]|uniref:hypothetical protein n=1 Tax=Ancylobacter lacus TaxID=2579970 RepID=UPI001BCE004A|nr:hypothetical protein [Ancylobacter lacus]MBS7539742.1 hypothetical protein [Ancylobacter lacus]
MTLIRQVPVPDPTSAMLEEPAERRQMAHDLRCANPRRLVTWRGFTVAGRHVNPYRDFAHAVQAGRPRDQQIAELLIGDIFADALLADGTHIVPLAGAS